MTSQPNPQGLGETSAGAKMATGKCVYSKNVGGPFMSRRARGDLCREAFVIHTSECSEPRTFHLIPSAGRKGVQSSRIGRRKAAFLRLGVALFSAHKAELRTNRQIVWLNGVSFGTIILRRGGNSHDAWDPKDPEICHGKGESTVSQSFRFSCQRVC